MLSERGKILIVILILCLAYWGITIYLVNRLIKYFINC